MEDSQVSAHNEVIVDQTIVTSQEPAKEKLSDVKQKESKKRVKHVCPLPMCESSVVHLPRHLRRCHGWSPRKSRGVLSAFNLRKTKIQTTKRSRRNYKSKRCPLKGCFSIVKRMQNHLTDVHKMKRGSQTYRKCLKIAVLHKAPVLLSTDSSEDSDDSISSSKSCKLPPKKIKMEKHVKNLGSMFQSVYGSSDSDDDVPVDDTDDIEMVPQSIDDKSTEEEEQNEDNLIENNDQQDTCIDGADHLDNDLPQLFVKFEEWLKGPDGGMKDDRCAGQCRRQIQLVINFIDPENPNLNNILHKQILRDKWLTVFDKDKQPGTVKSYLGALNQFYVFLKCECIEVDVDPEALSCLSDQAKLWARSYRKRSKDRFWEKRMEDMATIRKPVQVKEFQESDTARQAIKLMGEYEDFGGSLPPSQPEYTVVRDYLLTVLCINNGSRSGTLANMTLDEFKKVEEEDGCFVAKVRNHKTFTTHGPVHLVFSATLYKYVEIYITRFRNALGDVDKDGNATVFLTWSQCKMRSSQVGAQIGSCWGKVFGKESSFGGATAFRKAAVSAVHETNEDMRDDLANLMVHNKSTADRYYLLKNKGKTAVKTSTELAKIMGTTSTCTSNKKEETSSFCELNSSPRHKWTSEEVTLLKPLFASHIKNKSITLDEVRQMITKQPLLSNISSTKIRDKIRSYFNSSPVFSEATDDNSPSLAEPTGNSPSPPTATESRSERLRRFGLDLPEAETSTTANRNGREKSGQKKNCNNEEDGCDEKGGSEYTPSLVPPTTVSSKGYHQLLSNEDEALFKTVFFELIHSTKQISKRVVESILDAKPKLAQIVNQFTFRQLADKVRTERRIIARENQRRKKVQ